MKKTTLFLACCIGLMFFASCKKNVGPTITLIQTEGYVTANAQVYTNEDLLIGFVLTGEKLVSLETTVTQNGILINSYPKLLDEQSSYSESFHISIPVTGTITITAIVKDAAGQTAKKSFNIYCNEKPNAKFVGHYEGDILISGTADVVITNMEPMHEDLENQPFTTVVDIAAGDNNDEVTATITINGQSNTVKGTVNGDKVVFEAVNDTFTYTYQYQAFSIPIPLNMTYTINGTLNGEKLDLDGVCNGNGEINWALFNISGTFALDGTIGGSLNKTR